MVTKMTEFLDIVSDIEKQDLVLFRGQSSNQPLLPKIARGNPSQDTTTLEIKMLGELRRRGDLHIDHRAADDWDLLVVAQHYGMATRLLDWTSNPLVALWFACAYGTGKNSSYVYVFVPEMEHFLDRQKSPKPFSQLKTKVLKPNLNNTRIVAQSGWFTAHRYSKKAGRFVPLGENSELKNNIVAVEIPARSRESFLVSLDKLGINAQSIFPDIEGICRHLNWLHDV
jgi:hypothetical protein